MKKIITLLAAFALVIGMMPAMAGTSYADNLPELSNVKVSAQGVITWDPYPGAAKYDFSVGSGGGWCDIEEGLDVKDFLDRVRYQSGNYTVTLSAMDSDNAVIARSTVSYTYTSTAVKLDIPTNLKWEGRTARWDPVENATGYYVFLFEKDSSNSTLSRSVYGRNFHTFDVEDFTAGKQYRFEVYATGGQGYFDGERASSGYRPFMTSDLILPTIGNAKITGGILTWSPVSGAEKYDFSVSTGGGYCNVEEGVNLFEMLSMWNKPADTYPVTLKALNEYGGVIAKWEGSYVYSGDVKEKLATATNLRWDGNKARWDKVANATSYQVSLYSDGSYSYSSSFVSGDNPVYAFNDLEPNHKYTFVVVAYANGYDTSDHSAQSPVRLLGYTITLPSDPGYTIIPAAGTKTTVNPGDDFSFSVDIASGYEKAADFTVSANGTPLTEVDGVYKISDIQTAQTITVSGVREIVHVHDFTGQWEKDKDNHWHQCPIDQEKDTPAAHTFGETKTTIPANCTYPGETETECTVCGYTIVGTIAATGAHSYGVPVVTKATKSSDGSITETCANCGDAKSVAIPKVSNIKLSTTTYTYSGKAKSPTLTVKDSLGTALKKGTDYTVTTPSGRKNVGTYTYKITLKGNYSGTISKSFTINPVKTSITKLTGAKKSLTVKWTKKSTQVTGYRIQYSTSSKFSSPKYVTVSSYKTTSKTIKKLSAKKKYYVRVQTYKKVSGKTYYSSWSTAKNVKTK